jgi:hypothetical protein
MIECRSREDRLYVLATVCKQKNVTPNSNTYMTIIQTVCCGKFLLSKIKARELASTLTSAYKHDRWNEILGENDSNTESHQDTPQTTFYKPLKTKQSIQQQAQTLQHIAKKDTFNGVGRLHLAEIQLELGPLTADQIIGIWQAIYPEQTIQQNGNVLLIYWQGKTEMREQRNLKATIQPSPITMNPEKEFHVEPELQKDCESANKPSDKIICGEVSVDDSGVVADEEDLGED